ncbi:terminase small subunit [Candidatus Clostridium helianthi]|uniref:Terminase small subunit n=1 Tax=Candidatus Clostridium helianthi TaxID=3381660 RepID=A0ABW8S9Y4_9CLOT
MARQRSPARDEAFEIYKEHKGNITNREIANILNEDEKKIAVWKQRDKWDNNSNVVQQKNKCCTTNKNTNKKAKKKSGKEPIADEVEEIMSNEELTEKQRLFCLYYIQDHNATIAAIKAGYSKDTARIIGAQNLSKLNIKNELKRLRGLIGKEIFTETIDIYRQQEAIAFANINNFLEIDVKGEDFKYNTVLVKPSDEIDGSLISEVKQGKYGVSIKLYDKSKALDSVYNILKEIPKEEIQLEKEKLDLEKRKLEIEKLKAEITKLNVNGASSEKQKGNMDKLLEVFNKGPVVE